MDAGDFPTRIRDEAEGFPDCLLASSGALGSPSLVPAPAQPRWAVKCSGSRVGTGIWCLITALLLLILNILAAMSAR